MEKVASVHQRKSTKPTKNKKKPIKVVYISNPMKVKTCASKFRALVQQLTGQDSELPDPTAYSNADTDVGTDDMKIANINDHRGVLEVHDPLVVHPKDVVPVRPTDDFEPYDDIFTPQMLENFAGFLPSSLLYESPQVDVLRSFDAVQIDRVS